MSRQLTNITALFHLLLIAHTSNADPSLKHDYEPAKPRRQEVLKVTTETEYRFGNNSYIKQTTADKDFEKKIIDHSYQQIECSDTGETKNVFDKSLPIGWLYSQFSDTTVGWKNYFDTTESEHWVLPNVFCNTNRVLTAVSWMRSGNKGARDNNKKMAWRFRANNPPFYSSEINSISGKNGVFCKGWEGWMFEKEKTHEEYIDTLDNDELFTMVNTYCHNNHVTFLQHGYAGDKKYHADASDKPFEHISTPSSSDGSIGCSWQGWLLKDGTDNTHEDKGENTRWNYEKYFALDTKKITTDKPRIHGRVINPFCSKPDANKNGKVTRIRAYCFYPSDWKSRKTCASL